jgi:hypothetical protein
VIAPQIVDLPDARRLEELQIGIGAPKPGADGAAFPADSSDNPEPPD